MSVSAEWAPIEVKPAENLPGNCSGLRVWLFDESVKAEGEEEDLQEDAVECPSRAAENDEVNRGMFVIFRSKFTKLTFAVDAGKEKALDLAEKWRIIPEAAEDPAAEDPDNVTAGGQDARSDWSVSALRDDPATPNDISPGQQNDPCTENLSLKVEELNSSGKPLSVAAWVLDTAEAPVPALIVPSSANAAADYCAIDPETGTFLPALEHPETRLNHEMDLQSEPGWRRGNMTSDMQINRELKARAKLAQLLRERLQANTQELVNDAVPEEPESNFPRADCTIRPATDDDAAGIANLLNLERQASGVDHDNTSSAGIKNWDVINYFNKCKKGRRPFIVATRGEDDDLLDKSKWPAGADRAYEEYVKYRSQSTPQAIIVGFAFAMPQQSSIIYGKSNRIDRSCYVTLFVHPDHRNKKYGSALLDRVLMSVCPIHRSLIDFEWKCDHPDEIYEEIASNNEQQYARILVEYLEAHEDQVGMSPRKMLLKKFGFSQVGHVSCLESEFRDGNIHWLDRFTWELAAQSLEYVR